MGYMVLGARRFVEQAPPQLVLSFDMILIDDAGHRVSANPGSGGIDNLVVYTDRNSTPSHINRDIVSNAIALASSSFGVSLNREDVYFQPYDRG